MIEGSLEVKLPTMWTDGKAEVGQNTPASKHFWKLRYPKSARRCGAKHISKSKVFKTDGLGMSRATFVRSDVVWCGRCKGLCTMSKVSRA